MAAVLSPAAPSRLRAALAALLGDWMLLAPLILILLLMCTALLAPWIATHDPNFMVPSERLKAPSAQHWFGTDSLGRDVFSRAIYGTRASLSVALLAMLASVSTGLSIGLVAGFFRRVDAVVMRVLDGLMAIPGLLLAIAMVALNGANVPTLVLAIAIPDIPRVARLVRSVVLSVREEPYVEASFGMGSSVPRVLIWHVLPSTINPLVVQGAAVCAAAILVEAVLGFLGLGFPPETPSLGSIIADGRLFFQRAPWIVLCPGGFLAVLILAFNLFGDALRDKLDPRMARKSRTP